MSIETDVRRDVNVIIGERVHGLMWKQKRTQRQLGELLGVDQAAVSNRLRGKTNWQTFEMLAVAAWLSVPLLDLVPELELGSPPDGDTPNGGESAPSRARTEDLRIIRSDALYGLAEAS